MICPTCRKEFSEDAKFCDACGTSLIAPPAEPAPEQRTVSAGHSNLWDAPYPQKRSKMRIFLMGGISAVVAAIAAVVAILVIGIIGGRSDYALYLKDGEIRYTDFTDKGRMQLTDRLFSSEKPSAEVMSYFGSTLSYRVAFSEDGRRVFYCDRGDTGSEFTLYFRDLGRPNIEPIKLDSGVQWSFAINRAGTEVFYRKSDGSLYRHNLVERERIASDLCDDFGVADDCARVFYSANYSYDNGTFDVYVWHANGEKTKLASGVSEVVAAAADMSTIYYLRDDVLYRRTESEEREKLISGVYSVLKCYDDGRAYYTRVTEREFALADFVTDDTGGSRDFDFIREALANETVTLSEYSLYYFDGTTETKLCDNYDSYWDSSDRAPVLVFCVENIANIVQFKLSEVTSAGDVWNAVMYPERSREYRLAVGANVTEIEDAGTVADDGSLVYYFTQTEGGSGYDLWELPIASGKAGNAVKKDSDTVVTGSCFVGDKFVYYKNMSGGIDGYYGDLYIDGKLVDYDVWLWSVETGADGAFYYYSDYSAERRSGTLKRYIDGEKEKIADDVREYTVNERGDVLYLCDFSRNSHVGALYRFSGGRTMKIDDDVSAIIEVLDNVDKRYEIK